MSEAYRHAVATLAGREGPSWRRAHAEGSEGTDPRMGLVRRSEGRGPHVADRRHVHALVVGVHLRVWLPGRAHGSDARTGAGLLLVRRALHRPQGPRPR